MTGTLQVVAPTIVINGVTTRICWPYEWSYNPYKWPYKWATGDEVITLLMTGRGPAFWDRNLAFFLQVLSADKFTHTTHLGGKGQS